jgi:HEPN domain-containing protein
MNTSSLYHGLANDHQSQIDLLQQQIVATYPVTHCYLLGLTLAHKRIETLFTQLSASRMYAEHYFFLVLIQKSEDKLSSVQDKLENKLQNLVAATVIVLHEDDYTSWLTEGHPFANSVVEKGLLLYSKERSLPVPTPFDKEALAGRNGQLYTQTKEKIEAFLTGAVLYKLRKEWKLSCFMLHQTAEQALRTLLITNIGLRVISHNIEKMLRYTSMFAHEAWDIFSKKDKRNKRLLQLLNDAYLDARYREQDYAITYEELEKLFEKTNRLLALFEQYKP